MIRALLAKLLAMLRRPVLPTAVARDSLHVPISSHTRRYPGRTPAADLRHSLGWIAVTANRPHQDRRA